MGAMLDVFTLYRLTGRGNDCEHFLLLKVTRPGYSNVTQQEEDWANDVVTMRQRVTYWACILNAFCRKIVVCMHMKYT